MNELIKCRLCGKSYELSSLTKVQNGPKGISSLLPILLTGCGHTFCNRCVLNNLLLHSDYHSQLHHVRQQLGPNNATQQQQQLQHQQQRQHHQHQQHHQQRLLNLKCPTCGTTTTCEDINNLPVNHTVVELLRRQQSNNSNLNNGDIYTQNDIDSRGNSRPRLYSQRNQITGKYEQVRWGIHHQDHKNLNNNNNSNNNGDNNNNNNTSVMNILSPRPHNPTRGRNISGNFYENTWADPDEEDDDNNNNRRSRSFSCAPYQLNGDNDINIMRNIADDVVERGIASKVYPDISNDRKTHRLSFLRSNSTSDLCDDVTGRYFNDVISRPPPYNPNFPVYGDNNNNDKDDNNIFSNPNNSYVKKQPMITTNNNFNATILPSLPPLSTNLLHSSLENLTDPEVDMHRQILRFNKRLNTLPSNTTQRHFVPQSVNESGVSKINSSQQFQPSTMYQARLSRIIESETDMLAPTKMALSSGADFVTLVDQPANAVHLVSVKLNQRYSIKVPGVTGCCFINDSLLAITTSKSVRIYTTLGELKREMDLKVGSCVIGCKAMDSQHFAVICSKGLEVYKEERFCCTFVRAIKCKMMSEKGLACYKKTKLTEPKVKKKILSKSSPVEFSNVVDASWSKGMFAVYETHRNETVVLKKKNPKHNCAQNDCEEVLKKFITLIDDEFGLIYSSLDLTTNPINNNNDNLSFEPYSIALSSNGTLFVSDRYNGCVYKYSNKQGKYSSKADNKKSVACAGTSDGQKTQIFGIVLNECFNQLYVVARVKETAEIRVLNI